MKKSFLGTTFLALLAAASLAGCSSSSNETTAETAAETSEESTAEAKEADGDLEKLVVGASRHRTLRSWKLQETFWQTRGYDLEIVEYTDYVQPNNALESGDLDANYFQHKPYLDTFNEENGTHLVSAGAIHYEPFGIYAGKSDSLDELADGAEVLVPNDVTNEARALLLLQDQGLLTLKEDAGLTATINDITENPKNLDIVELEAAQLPRSLQDADIAVINGNYAIEAGLKVTDALAVESSDSLAAQTYGNVVAVREGDEESDKTKALMEVLTSDDIKEFIETKYDGAVVPLF